MTSKLKKQYFAPSVESVRIDREISLLMMTQPPANPTSSSVEGNNQLKSVSSSPFGGDKPDYSGMAQ
ncbi:MAG: hypothetical protein QM786_14895 [Breznakibacter sp.]